MAVLQIKRLKKSFGSRLVINNLRLSVPEHSIFGFIGKNGAGKTTTMRMILGLLKPDDGEIKVCGEQVVYGQTPTNKYIGYLPDVPEFYGHMRPLEYLKLCGVVTGMPKPLIEERSLELLDLVGLDVGKRKIAGFSRGMKQRLGIAQALLGEPKLLLCDEPTSALDPAGRKEILDILSKVRAKTTVVFSTHILSDVERICDEVAIIDEGRTALSGTLEQITSRFVRSEYLIEFMDRSDAKRYCAALNAQRIGVRTSGDDLEVRILLPSARHSGTQPNVPPGTSGHVLAGSTPHTSRHVQAGSQLDTSGHVQSDSPFNTSEQGLSSSSLDKVLAMLLDSPQSSQPTSPPSAMMPAALPDAAGNSSPSPSSPSPSHQNLWLVKLLAELDIMPVRFEVCEPNLEQVFLEVVK